MRWFRSNMHFGARLALIALALQFVLTFGHVHAPAAASTGLTLLSNAAGGSGSHGPADKGLADSDCPTCALIQLGGISAPAVAPALPLPAVDNFTTLRPHAELASATSSHFRFQARAPPSI
jgi:hypothetical protein